jgi:hypothetical protein
MCKLHHQAGLDLDFSNAVTTLTSLRTSAWFGSKFNLTQFFPSIQFYCGSASSLPTAGVVFGITGQPLLLNGISIARDERPDSFTAVP